MPIPGVVDVCWVIVDGCCEVGMSVAGASEEERLAVNAAICAGAASSGAAGVAIANGAQVLTSANNLTMDACGVGSDNPLTKSVNAGVEVGASLMSGGTGTVNVVRTTATGTSSVSGTVMEACGVDGAGADILSSASNIAAVDYDGNFDLNGTMINGAATVGAGSAAFAVETANNGGDTSKAFQAANAAGRSAQMATNVAMSAHDVHGASPKGAEGGAAPSSKAASPSAPIGGGEDATGTPEKLASATPPAGQAPETPDTRGPNGSAKDTPTARLIRESVDLGVGAVAAAVTYDVADRGRDYGDSDPATFYSAVDRGMSLRPSSVAKLGDDGAWTTKEGGAETAATAGRLASNGVGLYEVVEQERLRGMREEMPDQVAPASERLRKKVDSVSSGGTSLARIGSESATDWDAVWASETPDEPEEEVVG